MVLSIGIVLGSYCISSAMKYYRNFDRVVEVKGLAERLVRSNNGTWNIYYSATGDNLSATSSKISKDSLAIRAFLLASGFESSEIQSGVLSVLDNYASQYSSGNYNNDIKNKVPHYQVTGNIILTTNKVDKLVKASQNTAKLIDSGVIVSSNYLNYYYTDLNSIKPSMLSEAVDNARTSASSFATNTSSVISGIKSANQGFFSIMSVDGSNANDTTSVDKKIRVVTSMQFFIK